MQPPDECTPFFGGRLHRRHAETNLLGVVQYARVSMHDDLLQVM